MKTWKLIPVLAMVAGLFVSCNPEEDEKPEVASYQASLSATPSSQSIGRDGAAAITFSFSFTDFEGNPVRDYSKYTATVSFTATGGSVSPASATTDENGKINVVFTTPNPESFAGGTVKGVINKVKENGPSDGLFQQGELASATATVTPMSAADEPITIAEKLKDNTYSVQKKGGDAKVFNFTQECSKWYVGSSWTDGTKNVIQMECMDEDEKQMTWGWLNGEIPPELANKLITINQEFYTKYSWAGIKIGTSRLSDTPSNMIDARVGEGGNVKMDGSSQIWLKAKSGNRSYSGQYQLLFVLVFEDQTWDQETETYVPTGDEYTMCGNVTLDELVADLDWFNLDYDNNWLAPNQSVTLMASWTAGATFDWSKLTLDSQVCLGNTGEWFSWDASTRKLTAIKSADNESVDLTFGYKGTDMTYKITLFNGPGYNSFTITPRDGSSPYIIAENDPQGWSSNDMIYISVDSFTPNDYYSFNYHSIEIDPASDYYDKLYYNDYGPYVQFNHSIPEGDFNMILRSKADHSVKCTVPVKMVRHKPKSFTITYMHNNDYIHDDNIHGICNYPMGLSLGVITDPEDAYWNWAYVELANDYDGFSFSGRGGKDDHPKLERTKSNPSGGTSPGVQIIFRLKYDNKKTSTIYIDHN